MKKIWIVIVGFLLLNTVFADVIKNYHVDVTILDNGTIDVVETIEMDIDHKDVRLGIIRDIPSRYSTYTKEIETPIDVLSVTRNGEPENYWVEQNGDLLEIYTGAKYQHSDNYIPKGKNIYQLHWQSSNHIRSFAGYDELYFNAIGNNWQFSIERASVTLNLPDSVKEIQSAAYYGVLGETFKANVNVVSPQKIEFIVPKAIGNDKGLTIATGFTKGIIPSQNLGYMEQLIEKALSYFPPFVQPIHIALMGIVLAMFYYWLLGALIYLCRKPRNLRAFMVRLSPPKLSLDTMMLLVSKNYMENLEKFRIAFLVDLAHKGIILFNQSEKTIEIKSIGLEAKKTLTQGQAAFVATLNRNEQSKVSYAKYNPILENALNLMTNSMMFDGNKYYRPVFPFFVLSAFILWGICFALSFTIISGITYLMILFAFFGCLILWMGLSSLLGGQSFTSTSERIFWCVVLLLFGSIFSIMPLMFTDLLWIGFSWSAKFKASILVIIIILLFNTVLSWYGKIMMVLKPEYSDDQQQVLEFKHFLEYTKADEYQLITADLFEEYLPYAIAFGVDKKWLALYKKLYSAQYESSVATSGILISSISSSSTFKAASTKPSSGGSGSRSSGSGGGGSSGGGSGGGGGRGR